MSSDNDYQSLLQFLYRAPIGLIQTDASGNIEMVNPTSARLLLPLSPDGGMSNLFTILHDIAPEVGQSAASATEPGGTICEALHVPLPVKVGERRGPKDLSLSLFKLSHTRLMGVVVDVTLEQQREREELTRKLGEAARLDMLTGMPNRLAVIERLQSMMRREPAERDDGFVVFYIKCDRLTQVNDAFGRAVGDKLLHLLAGRLRAALRMPNPGDTSLPGSSMGAHLNEGDFIVLLERAGRRDDLYTTAMRLVDALGEPYLIGPAEIHCAASIGVVLSEDAADDADAVVQDASLAMAEAERAGGGRYVVFDRTMRLRATQRGNLEADLRRALNEQQLFVVYQPVVGLQGPRCIGGAVDRSAGVEALVRWRHPTRGILSPDAFIGMAEECGLIGTLGEFVLRTACNQFMAWQAQLGVGAPRMLAVNLSRAELGLAGLTTVVEGIILSSGIPPDQLQLEVTESLAAQDQTVQSRLRDLKALGLTLALDDFGTGYSSLSSLDQLPVDTVKIDRSFVTDAPGSPHRRALIDATIRMAHALDMTTVAEGIESEAEAKVIRDLGCDKGQGFLFSKPLSAGKLLEWLTRV
jgi:diguanylate cyclase (GGDEF)-like protein